MELMNEAGDVDRVAILKLVEDGELSPSSAETRAKNWGLAPLSTGPSSGVSQPPYVDKCTLAMGAAWFLWRNWEAIFHQTELAREEWKVWEPILKNKESRNSAKKFDMARAFMGTPYRLVQIGPARLWRVFYEARWDPSVARWTRYSREHPSIKPSHPNNDLPFRRFKTALQTGKLPVTNIEGRQGEGVMETVDYWVRYFDRYALPNPAHRPLFPEETYYVSMQAVINAETEISQSEIEPLIVGLTQAVGWAAYQKRDTFRSLSQEDVKGKAYYDQLYKPDFPFPFPDAMIYEALLEQKLKCFRRGIELTRPELMKLGSIWDASDIQFFRKDLLTIWPDTGTGNSALNPARSSPHITVTGEQPPAESELRVSTIERPPGPPPVKRKEVVARMLEALRSKATTAEELQNLAGKVLRAKYGPYSPTTMNDALKEALAIFRSSNSDK